MLVKRAVVYCSRIAGDWIWPRLLHARLAGLPCGTPGCSYHGKPDCGAAKPVGTAACPCARPRLPGCSAVRARSRSGPPAWR